MKKKDILGAEKNELTSLKKAIYVGYAVKNKKGINPVVLDLNMHSDLADYFIITSGRTSVQVRSIVSEIERICKAKHIQMFHVEGLGLWSWVLIDLGDVVVHVFNQKEREYYNLEKLWQKCKKVNLPKL